MALGGIDLYSKLKRDRTSNQPPHCLLYEQYTHSASRGRILASLGNNDPIQCTKTAAVNRSNLSRSENIFKVHFRCPVHPHIAVYFKALLSPWYTLSALCLVLLTSMFADLCNTAKNACVHVGRHNSARWTIHLHLRTSQWMLKTFRKSSFDTLHHLSWWPYNVALSRHSSQCSSHSEVYA